MHFFVNTCIYFVNTCIVFGNILWTPKAEGDKPREAPCRKLMTLHIVDYLN